MSRREFIIQKITVNGRFIRQVIVDDYVEKHTDITDDLILDLVRELDGVEQLAEDFKPPFEYFSNLLEIGGKQYRLVWLLEEDKLYVGVVNTYRDNRKE